jgi:hypothetical protein
MGGALVALGAALLVLLGSRRYEAEATLEYRPAAAGLAEPAWHELLATESAILRSRFICERAARAMGGRATPDPTDGAHPLCESIDVERESAARVLHVRASHHDARLAAQLVEGVAQAYLDRHAEQTREFSPAVTALVSELGAQGRELDLLESETEAYARERSLLTYDAELERSELALLKQELAQRRIQEITLGAELKQLEQAIKTRSFSVQRLASDPRFQEQRRRLASLAPAAENTPGSAATAQPDKLQADLAVLAQEILAAARAELELVREQRRQLAEYQTLQEERLIQRETDLVELRQRRREVSERQAVREALLKVPPAAGSRSVFEVRLLDHGHVVGRRAPSRAWWWAAALALLGAAGLARGVRIRA